MHISKPDDPIYANAYLLLKQLNRLRDAYNENVSEEHFALHLSHFFEGSYNF